jgi:PAS domain S-box-containing protein
MPANTIDSYKELYEILKRSVLFFNRQFSSTNAFYAAFINFLRSECYCSASAICELDNDRIHLRNEKNLSSENCSLLDNKSIFEKPYDKVFENGEIVSLDDTDSLSLIVPIKNRYFVYGAFFVRFSKEEFGNSILELFETISVSVAAVLERLQRNVEKLPQGPIRTTFTEDTIDSIINALPDPFFIKDTSGRYISCNQAFAEFIGKPRDEIIGGRLNEISNSPEVDRHQSSDAEVLRSRMFSTYESTFHGVDGVKKNIVVTKNVFFDSEAQPAGIVGSIRDITRLVTVQHQYEQKNNELMKINAVLLNSQKDIIDYNKRLTESEEKYRLLIENQQEFIVKLDVLGHVLFMSQSMSDFLPPYSTENESLRLQNLLIGNDRIVFDTILRESAMIEHEHEVEFRMRSASNLVCRISWSFKPVFEGRELDYIIGVGRDVTERWTAEQELANFRSLLEAAFEQSPSASVLIRYPDKTIMMINEAAQRFLNLPNDDYVGMPVDELYFLNKAYIEDKHIDMYQVLKSEKLYHESHTSLEVRFVSETGIVKTALLFTTPIYNNIGELNSYLLIFPEITELRKAEQRIEEQNREIQKIHKLESIGVLAGGIAHDFNNILGAVLGNLSLLRMYNPDEKISKIVTKAENAVARAKELTSQLLTFSKGGAPIKKSTLLNDIIRDSALFTLHGTKVDIQFSLDSNLRPGLVDGGQISQVVQNLVINAVQAMSQGGTITLSSENVNIANDELPLQEGPYIKLTVTDTGPGISLEHLDKIFDPFFTTKPEGNGLGLATSYNIIKNHGGYITLETGNDGTSFYIYLPVSDKEPEIVNDEEPGDVTYSGSILIMDDEEAILDVASSLFTILGFQVETSLDGQEAIEKTEKRIENQLNYEIYVLDLTVPGGMGGQEALERLKVLDPGALFVVSSGYANNLTMSHYKEYGFHGILEKPYKIEDVRKLLKEISYERTSH